jgi:hypothetical protein
LNDGINNSGTISADNPLTNTRGILIEDSSLNGGISNSGTIYGSYSGIRIDNSSFNGGINNSETGIIRASSLGIHIIRSSFFNGGINNAGTINAIAIEGSTFNGGISNAGTIDTHGIQINYSQFTGGINNSGNIIGGSYGDAISTYNASIDAITNTVTGIISAPGPITRGINNVTSTIETITNLGSISGDFGIYNIGRGAIINTLNNSGTISGLNGLYNIGILNDADSAIGTLTNTGTISGGRYGIFNDYAMITSLINSGTISSANGDAINTYNDTVLSGGIPSISTLTNTGTISSLDNSYGINTEWGSIGTIGTLNNLQGVGNAAGPLTYNGYLPTNYNLIIPCI